MVPAHQSFGADDPPGLDIDLWLVKDLEFAALQSSPHVVLEGQPLGCSYVHGRGVQLIVVPSCFLGAVHCRIGISHQCFTVIPVVRIEAYADAGGPMQVESFYPKRALLLGFRRRVSDERVAPGRDDPTEAGTS